MSFEKPLVHLQGWVHIKVSEGTADADTGGAAATDADADADKLMLMLIHCTDVDDVTHALV